MTEQPSYEPSNSDPREAGGDVAGPGGPLAARNGQADEFTKAIADSPAWVTEPPPRGPSSGGPDV
ncbi:MAG: hypothetical protein JWP11_2833 [Frankiales bacterium]|nr:hypothetical protein [Frankiales bacterium]